LEEMGRKVANGGPRHLDDEFWCRVNSIASINHVLLRLFVSFLRAVKVQTVLGAQLWDDHTYWFIDTRYLLHPEKISISRPLRIENVVPLLKLPTLRILHLSNVIVMRQEEGVEFPWDDDNTRIYISKASSGLEDLYMGTSFVPTTSLVAVLNTMEAL
jgi:hypothetical protein